MPLLSVMHHSIPENRVDAFHMYRGMMPSKTGADVQSFMSGASWASSKLMNKLVDMARKAEETGVFDISELEKFHATLCVDFTKEQTEKLDGN